VVQSTVFSGVFCIAALIVEGLAWGLAHERLGAAVAIPGAILALLLPTTALALVVRRALRDGVRGLLARREAGGPPPSTSAPIRVESLD
jgi:hypothetical protein